jgi:hypothetical protein
VDVFLRVAARSFVAQDKLKPCPDENKQSKYKTLNTKPHSQKARMGLLFGVVGETVLAN